MADPTQTSPESFKLEQFGGMLPAWDDHLIPQGQAASSENAYLFSGALAGWRKPKALYTLQSGTSQFAYRLPTQTENIANAILYVHVNPVEGDKFTLGEEIYTFTATVTAETAAYMVQIGATTAATATNIYAAVTFDDGAGTNAGVLYGVGTVANPAVNQEEPDTTNILALDIPRIQFFAPDSGAAYNSTLVGENTGGVRLQWIHDLVNTTTLDGGTNLSFDASITGASVWLEFDDPDTDVMRSPVVDDRFDRYYFASPSVAPMYNTRARIENGDTAWLLGVPPPGCTPGVEVTGGGDDVVVGKSTALSAATDSEALNTIYLIPITPDGAISLNDIHVMPQTDSATARIVGLVYGDLDGNPHELIDIGVEVVGVEADTAAVSTFQNPASLSQGIQYWIGYATNETIDVQRADDALTTGVISQNTYTNGPPAFINGLTVGYFTQQVWGTGTSAALLEARSYVYTYVTEYDEESAPSQPTIVNGWSNGSWTVSLFTPPPDQMGVTRNITLIRLYRTITSQAGTTTYFFVAEMPVTTGEYVDTISDDIIVGNLQLQSQLWTPPPVGLLGIMSMPNGMSVGWKENEIWFAEPYRPHAWPSSYVLTTEYPIVGLGVTGTSVVACTSGAPYIATGSAPGQMSATKIQNSEPCHSRGAILGNNDGVYYSSPNGLILVTQYGAVTNTSELWITRERWRELSPQKNVRAVFMSSCYYALGCTRDGDASVAQQGFTIELNAADAQSFTIWPQPGGHRLGFQKLTSPNALDVVNVRIDPWSGTTLIFYQGVVYYFDFSDQAPVSQVYTWKSKLFQQKSKKNFEAMRIWFSIPDGTPALNATRLEADTDDPVWDTLPADRYGFIRVFAGGRLVTTREIRVPQELLRILSGFKYETWQWEIEARVPISNIQIGSSVKAMARS